VRENQTERERDRERQRVCERVRERETETETETETERARAKERTREMEKKRERWRKRDRDYPRSVVQTLLEHSVQPGQKHVDASTVSGGSGHTLSGEAGDRADHVGLDARCSFVDKDTRAAQ
jgi:hypothetical protein